jgi:glucose-1-phosphate thymidylyltransferase
MKRKGILLAGGTGSRLAPLTNSVSKQLLPVYDKPMIFYPLSTLMLAGIREILIITTPIDRNQFERLLGNGSDFGISIKYEEQQSPEGIAQAFLIGEKFLNGSPVALILGDNLFHGHEFTKQLNKANNQIDLSTVFAYPVIDPQRYGVVVFDNEGNAVKIEEKPEKPSSRFAITGLYFYDSSIVDKAKKISPSPRGELEITSINQLYLQEKRLKVELMGRGMAWLDTGTFDSLQEAGAFIKTLENRQGLKIGSPEEVAWRNFWIDNDQLKNKANQYMNSGYGDYLLELLSKPNSNLVKKNSDIN